MLFIYSTEVARVYQLTKSYFYLTIHVAGPELFLASSSLSRLSSCSTSDLVDASPLLYNYYDAALTRF